MIEARAIVKVLKEDKAALKELAEELVLQPDIRLAIINAVLRDVATKDYVREEIRASEERLRAEIQEVKSEIQEVKRDLRAMLQIGFTGLGLLIVALGFYLGYLFKG